MMSPRVHPAPQWLTPIAVVTHCGWPRRLVGLAYRQCTHSANGPKYNAVIGHPASMTRIGCRLRRTKMSKVMMLANAIARAHQATTTNHVGGIRNSAGRPIHGYGAGEE